MKFRMKFAMPFASHCIRKVKLELFQCVAVCCSVMQYVAVCCSVLQCVAVSVVCLCVGYVFVRERDCEQEGEIM